MYKLDVDLKRRLITFRASGTLRAEDTTGMGRDARIAADKMKNQPHIVLADMRGMTAMSPEAAETFGEVIRYGREHGTILCVHISDSTIAKLQAARLAREATPSDDITVNVVSLAEADKVIDEKLVELGVLAARR